MYVLNLWNKNITQTVQRGPGFLGPSFKSEISVQTYETQSASNDAKSSAWAIQLRGD